jgi:hypothetical protein
MGGILAQANRVGPARFEIPNHLPAVSAERAVVYYLAAALEQEQVIL